MTEATQRTSDSGVSIWLDDLSRTRIESGNLQELIKDKNVVGVTTNPSIFQKALSQVGPYDAQLKELGKVDVETAIRELTTTDVRNATDIFREIAEATDFVDGRVSIEVDPRLAHDTENTAKQAVELWEKVNRPNAMIKIPATLEGLPAITATLAKGISVNVTLIFSLERYEQVIDAFIEGIAQADANGHDLKHIGSVASFFVSRADTAVDKLLEAVLLTADAELDLRANPDMDARGATVEARLDKGRGAVATVLVQSGTLHIGDSIVAGTSYGRVRAMLDENGTHMKEATPSTPVQVLGLTSVPTAGDLFLVASDDRTARQIAEKRQATERAAQLAKRRKVVSLESLKEQFAKAEVDMLNLVIKGDSSGSVEALEDSLMKSEVSDEVGIQVIHRGGGAITQNDVNLATVDKAVIIGFNVRPNRQVADMAEREGVEIKYYSIIYKAIEDIEASLKGMLKPEFEEVVTSHSEIREIFRSSKFGNIAGVMVQDGEVKRGTKCRILRNGVATVNDLEISSLRRFKDDVNSVKEGYEAGINLGSFNDIELGDIIETFEMQEIERK